MDPRGCPARLGRTQVHAIHNAMMFHNKLMNKFMSRVWHTTELFFRLNFTTTRLPIRPHHTKSILIHRRVPELVIIIGLLTARSHPFHTFHCCGFVVSSNSRSPNSRPPAWIFDFTSVRKSYGKSVSRFPETVHGRSNQGRAQDFYLVAGSLMSVPITKSGLLLLS